VEKFEMHWKNSLRIPGSSAAIPGQSLMGMIDSAKPLTLLQFQGFCRVYYTKAALKYGWREIKKVAPDGQTVVLYLNNHSLEESKMPPIYTPHEHFHAGKIQGAWAVCQAKKLLKSLLLKDSMGVLVASAILRYQKHAYIGYGLEAVSVSQMLYRAGYPDLGEAVESYLSTRPSVARDLTVDSLLEMPREKYSGIGVSRHGDVKDLEKFKEWWNTTPPEKRTQSLTFLNYFSGPEDQRSIEQCIQDSDLIIRQRLTRAYRNSVSRIQSLCSKMLQSKFPITKCQLESFLELYSGKPGLAQVRISLACI
jgi:hypothetical protein